MALILVVEDDPLLRAVTRAALQAAGHLVIEAENGEQGLYQAGERHPELIITDVNMAPTK